MKSDITIEPIGFIEFTTINGAVILASKPSFILLPLGLHDKNFYVQVALNVYEVNEHTYKGIYEEICAKLH
jgi:hypothetical protein